MNAELVRVIAVVALVCAAAAICTPPGRLPLALRGLLRTLGRRTPDAEAGAVPAWKKVLALLLVAAAAAIACLRVPAAAPVV